MARPKPQILKQIELGDGSTWDVLQAEEQYTITYKGQPCGIRQHYQTLTHQGFKYQKLSYTNYGNALAQVRRLNHKFQCEDFAVKQV
jgi:hypothetical protein